MKYSFNVDSKIDTNLTIALQEAADNGQLNYDAGKTSIRKWELFLESFPEIEAAKYDIGTFTTTLTFNDEFAHSMFLLRWS